MKHFVLKISFLLIFLPIARVHSAVYTLIPEVNPSVVLADGTSTAIISVQIREEGGKLVSDKVRVDFATTLGTITPWAFAEEGVARAEIRSTKPGVAVVTISCLGSTVQTRLSFVSDKSLLYKARGPMRVKADYLAWCADAGILDATGNVRIEYRGLLIEGDSLQIDAVSNTLKGLGARISNGITTLQGDRLYWDFSRSSGLLLIADEGVRALAIEGWELKTNPPSTPLPESAFEFYDPASSQVVILAREALVYPGERVYLKQTNTFVNGSKVLSLPYQLIRLSAYGDYSQQMLNWGTSGIAFDFPFYYSLQESYVGALHLKYATTGGLDPYSVRQGWQVALDQQYEFSKAVGSLLFEQGEGKDWDLSWQHSHSLTDNFRLYLYSNYLARGDRYNRASLRGEFPSLSLLYNIYQRKYKDYSFLGQDLSLRMRPQRIGKFSIGAVGRIYERDIWGREIFLQCLSPSFKIGNVSSLDLSLETGYQWGKENSGVYAFNAYLSNNLREWGSFSFSYTKFKGHYGFNKGENIGLNLFLQRKPFSSYFYVNKSLEEDALYSYGKLSWEISPKWGFHLRSYSYKLGPYKFSDIQYILSKDIGGRDLYIYWSKRDKKLELEIAQGGF